LLHNQKSGIVKKDMVPVRESKLTFLLQSPMIGQEKFVMIVNLLSTIECFEQNINVLHFGSITQNHHTKNRGEEIHAAVFPLHFIHAECRQ
jgi:hypothetical protein